MQHLNQAYINGNFVALKGNEVLDIVSPVTERIIAKATLGNREDAKSAILAAYKAQPAMAKTTKTERIEMLMQLREAVLAEHLRIRDTTIEEYGGPIARAQWVSQYASQCFANAAQILKDYPFSSKAGSATVVMEPVGVAALIAPWNSTAGTLCSKLAYAIAAGCTSVIKPSELSPLQTRVVTEALHQAALPDGIFNVLIGRGIDVGDEICTNPAITKISFTGSTQTGKLVAQSGLNTMKRVSLALSGKSAAIVLEDADLPSALSMALNSAFLNNGQACVSGSRLLVPGKKLEQVIRIIKALVDAMQVGDPHLTTTMIGPLANLAQYNRVQHFISRGIEQGATLLAGGLGKPQGLQTGYFVKPTVFSDVQNHMDIAREEIFGPVLSILTYDTEEDAIALANDSDFGLQAYLFSSQPEKAARLAERLVAGTVLINRITPDLLAPFGGVKQSGIGREFGVLGLESYLEPKTIVLD